MGLMRWDRSTRKRLGVFRRHCIRGGRGKLLIWVGVVDDYVKHVLREHNQEADHRANLGAEGQR